MTRMQAVIRWLNTKDERSALVKTKRRIGLIIRSVLPRWRGLSEILMRVHTMFRGPLVRCEVEGAQLWVDARDRVIGHYLLSGYPYEQDELDLVRKCLEPGGYFLDVGANIGYFAVLAAKHVGPSGRVVALEPEPHNFKILRRNIGLNGLGNVRAVNYAAVDRPQSLTLYLSSYNFGDHRIFDGDDDSLENLGTRQNRVQVRGIALDQFLQEERFAPDLIKIDVQGAEQSVLAGLRETLSTDADIRLLMEFWPHGMRRFGTDPAELLTRLRALGFQVFQLLSGGTLTTFSVHHLDVLQQGPREYANIFACRRPDQLDRHGIRVAPLSASSTRP